MKQNKYFSFILIFVASIVLVAAGLLTIENSRSEIFPTQPSVKLKVGYIPIIDCSQIYVASLLGYFSESGIDIEMVPLAGGPAIIQALSSDAIDIGFANLATVVFFEQSSPRLNRLAGGTQMNKEYSEAGLVALSNSGIDRISDLKGKTIAVNSRRNIVDLAVLKAIKKSGLSAKDVTLVELPFKDMEAAIRAKKVDAATLPEPLLSMALKTGGLRNLGDHFAIAFGEVYSTGYFSMPNSAKVTPDIVQKFNSAMSRATQDLNNPTELTTQAVASATKLPLEALRSVGKPKFIVQIPESAFTQMKVWLEEEGLLETH